MTISDYEIHLGLGKRNYAGFERVSYEIKLNGATVKAGSGWGMDGAWNAAEKARKRLVEKQS